MTTRAYILLFIAFVLSHFTGCAYKGNVNIYSPSGSENSVEKSTDLDSDVGAI
jgi:hypothetical protein